MKLVNLKGIKITESLINVKKVLGEAITIQLKAGGAFYFKVTGCGETGGKQYIDGFDEERLNLRVNVEDIDFIIGRG